MVEQLRLYLHGTLLLKLFGKTDGDQLACCSRLRVRSLQPDELLYGAGEPADCCYHVLSGRLDVLAADGSKARNPPLPVITALFTDFSRQSGDFQL